MFALEKLKALETKLSSDIWQYKFNESIDELNGVDLHDYLSIRKETFARVISIIKQLSLNYEGVVLFEAGAGSGPGGGIDRCGNLYSSNIANFFLYSDNKMFEYYAFDRGVQKEEEFSSSIVNQYLFNFVDFKQKVSEVIDKGKIPVILSNLVLGYCDKTDSLSKWADIICPPFWSVPGIHIHQYLSKDLMTSVDVKSSREKSEREHQVDIRRDEEIRSLPDKQFANKMFEFMVSRYDVDNEVYTTKLPYCKSNSNTISIWINSKVIE